MNIFKKLFSNQQQTKLYLITQENLFLYSEHIKHFHVPEKLTDDDIIQISHKLADDKYETTFIRLKQLKEYLNENK